MFVGCSSLKKIEEKPHSVEEKTSETQYFTDFYKVSAIAFTKKPEYKLSEEKRFDLKLTNYGVKDLFVPKYFDKSGYKDGEFYIELFKKTDNDYVPYKQISKLIETNVHTNTMNRKVLSTKNGTCINYENIELDTFLKIVDEGEYLAKIYIDLSNFGYFKIIKSSALFKVVND